MNVRTQELLDNAKRHIGARRTAREAGPTTSVLRLGLPERPHYGRDAGRCDGPGMGATGAAAHLAERPAGSIHDRHYVPSFETRRLVLAKLRELEKGVVAA